MPWAVSIILKPVAWVTLFPNSPLTQFFNLGWSLLLTAKHLYFHPYSSVYQAPATCQTRCCLLVTVTKDSARGNFRERGVSLAHSLSVQHIMVGKAPRQKWDSSPHLSMDQEEQGTETLSRLPCTLLYLLFGLRMQPTFRDGPPSPVELLWECPYE